MNIKYSSLTKEDKLSLKDDGFLIAVKLEAIDRGIEPPIKLSEALKRSEYTGFSILPESIPFYEILVPGSYNDTKRTGLAYRTMEEAESALVNAFAVHEDGYGSTAQNKFNIGQFTIRKIFIGLQKQKHYHTQIEEYLRDNEKFDKLCEECREDLSKVHQDEYNKKILAQKKEEYLGLAQGNIEIAKNFWTKTQGSTPFPE